MPSKKKKYNARFPAGRIKKIMQSDEEVGKVAQAVPIIISRTLELFVESLLTKTLRITNSRNAKTLSPSHMKQCIMAESRFDFLRDIVKNVPDINVEEQLQNAHGQSYAHHGPGSEPDDDQPLTVSYAPVTTARESRTSTGQTPIQPSTSQYGGVFAPIEGHRNGLKRSISTGAPQPIHTAHPQYYETGGRSTIMHKQQSLDLSLATGPKNCTIPAANYYTEIQSDDPMPAIGVRPNKMPRLNSHPVTVSTTSRTAVAAAAANLHPASAAVTTPTAAPPVINFDIRNGVATTILQQYSPMSANHLPTPGTPDPTSTLSAGAIDVCNSPLVKIDYSQLDLSTPPCPSVSTTTTTATTRRPAANAQTTPAYTKVPAPRGRPPKNRTTTAAATATATTTNSTSTPPPVMTFDFTNLPAGGSSSSKTPTFTTSFVAGPSTSRAGSSSSAAAAASSSNGTPRYELAPFVAATSTCLDMDEDYDDI